jgi:hypothetical protein
MSDTFKKEMVDSYVIGVNPTGILSFDGTFKMQGQNNIIMSSSNISKDNLKKTQNNEFVCHTERKETFSNRVMYRDSNKNRINVYLLLYLIILSILLILFI